MNAYKCSRIVKCNNFCGEKKIINLKLSQLSEKNPDCKLNFKLKPFWVGIKTLLYVRSMLDIYWQTLCKMKMKNRWQENREKCSLNIAVLWNSFQWNWLMTLQSFKSNLESCELKRRNHVTGECVSRWARSGIVFRATPHLTLLQRHNEQQGVRECTVEIWNLQSRIKYCILRQKEMHIWQ